MATWLDRLRAAKAAPAKPQESPEAPRALSLRDTLGLGRGQIQDLNHGDHWGGAPVGYSADLQRVLDLPRRAPLDLNGPQARALVAKWTGILRKPGGTQELFPIQAWALEEISTVGGLIGPIGVGHGKTLLDILAPLVLPNCKAAVLLIEPGLASQFLDHDWGAYGRHWQLPNLAGGRWFDASKPVLHVVRYSMLSSPKSSDLLERLAPDFIIADEAQNLKDRKSARTMRFLRYFSQHPSTRFAGWSGTMVRKSLKDFAHLTILALRERAPVPLHWATVEEWAKALDPHDFPAPAGALQRLCEPGEPVRLAYRRRLKETAGWVATEERSIDTPLVITERRLATKVPDIIRHHLHVLKETWTRPDGEEFYTAIERANCARQLACGFFYRWTFPRGEDEDLILEWLACRKAWFAELRDKLKLGRVHLDSPLLCWNAAARHYAWKERGEHPGTLPTWAARTWPAWVAIRDRVKPETEAVWVDDFLARDAAQWAQDNVGIVWYQHDTFGRRVAELSGKTFYGPGKEASAAIRSERGDRAIVASIKAHGVGKNLQMFRRSLVANPPGDGGDWEQLLGRTHRKGQEADEVLVQVYRHVEQMVAAVDRAHSLSNFIEELLGTSQKLARSFDAQPNSKLE